MKFMKDQLTVYKRKNTPTTISTKSTTLFAESTVLIVLRMNESARPCIGRPVGSTEEKYKWQRRS